jgi:putative DNA primase/helicase
MMTDPAIRAAADEVLRAAGRGDVVDERLADEAAFTAVFGDGPADEEPSVEEPADVMSVSIWPPPSDPMAVARAALPMWTVADVDALRFWRAGWMVWRASGQWVEVERSAVSSTLYETLEHAVYPDGDDLKDWRPNRKKIGDLLEAFGAITFLPETVDPPAWLDDTDGPPPGEVVACTNGLLHVTTRTLLAHDPRFFTRVAVPFPYEPDGVPPERWLAFLDDLWPGDTEAIAALQEWFGYVISGRTDLHKILLLVGPMRSGKGTIARVLTALVGKPNVAGPTLASLGMNFGLSPLLAKTLAIVSDARLGTGSDTVVERLLSISGEDAITVDRKYREPWTGKLGTRFFVISNELPNFGDASGAIATRFVVLELRESWLGRENTRLTDELLTELPGILRWALDGLDRLITTDRFTTVHSSEDAIAALADMVSPIGAFVRECCVVGPAFEVPVRQLYDAWKDWCVGNGHYHAGTIQRFGRDLRAAVPGLKVARPSDAGRRHRSFVGLGVLSGSHSDADRGPTRTASTDRDLNDSESAPDRVGPRSSPPWSPLHGSSWPIPEEDS